MRRAGAVSALARAVALVVVAAASGACTHSTVRGLAPVRPELFDRTGRVEVGAYGAAYNANGTVLAVKSGQGIGAVSSGGKVRLVTPPGSHAVEYAWMPSGDALLIAEGPASTGQLDVLRLDGTSLGAVPLNPSFSVGSGYGMAVSPDGRRAVVVAEDAQALGGPERLHLKGVDLATGAVTELGPRAVHAPRYVDGDHVLVTAWSPSQKADRAEVVTVSTGAVRVVSAAGEAADALGPVLGPGNRVWLVYATDKAVWAVPVAGGQRVRLGAVPKGATAVAVDPFGTQALLAERNRDAEQLRALTLRGLPSTGGGGG
ncbi:MAG TPA: hypothetical protein VFA83_25770 [Acidimicrobiales bacterium]|nr:hypothetical protein [Acidimicrobiales bacterium]